MKCKDLMKTNAQSISPDAPAQAAARQMKDQGIGFLPVCDDAGKVLGTITDRDIAMRVVAGGKSPGTPVREVMTDEVVACGPEDELSEAESLMAEGQKSRLLITTEDGKLAGVISLSDIARVDTEGAVRTMRGVTSREARAS